MSRVPRKPRPIARSSELTGEAVASRATIAKRDPRQPDLFTPTFVPPCKPTLAGKVPVGELWQYEIKHDGYRIQAHLHEGEVWLFTKSGLDWTDRMPGIAEAVRALPVRSAILDGEAIMEDEEGVSDFFALHAALAQKRAPHAILMAFDLLSLEGVDLRDRALVERRGMLAETLVQAAPGLDLSPHSLEGGEGLLKAACERGLEGIVAKRRNSPYRSGRVESWLKIKCTNVEAFAVIGHEPEGRSGVRSLKLASLAGEALVPCGSVGSGLAGEVCRKIREALNAGQPVVVEVEHRGRTPAGELRHPVFKGWHEG
jgi:bifunctional non-homologous end joining protein LigD